jgi:hypothetical protein
MNVTHASASVAGSTGHTRVVRVNRVTTGCKYIMTAAMESLGIYASRHACTQLCGKCRALVSWTHSMV